MTGRLIVFEGGEGCGKTTQLNLLRDWLFEDSRSRGEACFLSECGFNTYKLTREPGGTIFGSQLRRILLENRDDKIASSAELLAYAADRAQHVATVIRPALKADNLVISDRFTASTIAYQGYGRGLDIGLINQINQIATEGIEPDLTIYLDLDPLTGLARAAKRGSQDRIEQADIDFHRRVQSGFRSITLTNPSNRFVTIDASPDRHTVQTNIREQLFQSAANWNT